MTRRARVVLVSAAALLALFAAAVALVVATTGTQFGRDRLRALVVSTLQTRIRGKLYVGRVTSGFLGGFTVDSLAIRDPHDSLFVSTGRLSVRYDLRDLLDRRILLRGVRVEHPVVHIRQHQDGTWNFREIFPSAPKTPLEPAGPAPFIVLDSAVVHDGSFMLTLPWHPSPRLRGAQRDSAIRFELARSDLEIRRAGTGFTRTWRWTGANVTLAHARISDPDSAGMEFVVDGASVREFDPPFSFSSVRGRVRQLGDSVWVDIPHFELPRSVGSGTGKIVWGGDLPIRYDLRVRGDSVSLTDVAWVYPTLPRTGSGRTLLHIVSERDPRFTDYVLSDMDVRSTRSRLRGTMTFVLGGDTLAVRDVRLQADPVNFDLLRTLNGKPFPYDWQGDIRGTVRASGGNLGRFRVEDARLTFADANVPGAITRGSARGEIDIVRPAFTAFHGLFVDVQSLDLRTPQHLNPNFPRLAGTISGTAVLDSSWLDVRFRDARITHRDGDGPESFVTGKGRVTWGEKYLTYDLALDAAPLAFATIGKSYQGMPLRASMSGPISVVGQSPDLRVSAILSSGRDTLTWDGRVDADPPVYGAHGTGSAVRADLRTLLGAPALPRTALTGTFALDVTGDSVADFTGTASASLASSAVGPLGVQSALARLRFDAGALHVDTLRVRSREGNLDASGIVALTRGRGGKLDYRTDIPSLGALAHALGDTSVKLAGRAMIEGTLSGNPDSLATAGTVTIQGLGAGTARAARAFGRFALSGIPRALAGTATIEADSAHIGVIPVNHARLAARLSDGRTASLRLDASGQGGMHAAAAGVVQREGKTTFARVDSLELAADSTRRYALTAPALVTMRPGTLEVDSLVMARSGGGVLALRALHVAGDSLHASLRARGLALDLLELLGAPLTGTRGTVTASVDVDGTTRRPRLFGSVVVRDGAMTVVPVGMRMDRVEADVSLEGDTVRVRRLSATTRGERRGTLDVRGTISLERYADPVFALKATAHNFRAIDRRGLASLELSTPAPITLTGPYTGAVVGGRLVVDRGTVYIPEVVRKRVLDLSDPELYDVVDTMAAANRAVLPAAPSTFTRNLRLSNLAISVGNDVWLRSDEANIKLGGSLNVTLGRAANRSRLALEGELTAQRGTYRLNVVPFVQPTFDVERGTLRFYGTPDLDPALDITAINTVRRPSQSLTGQDIRIRATIGGTLSAPTLTLSSADNLPLSQSDLLSYLITGQPSFALDSKTQQYVNQLASVAVRSAGNLISSAIPRSIFDVVELQTPSLLTQPDAGSSTSGPTFYSNLLSTRATVGKQLNGNLFLNFSTGFCSQSFRNLNTFSNNLGIRLEYRLGQTYTAQLGIEPGTLDLVCARPGTAQLLQQTPPQFGVDFMRSWRF